MPPMAFASKQKEVEYITNFMKEKYDRVVLLRNKGDKAKLKQIAQERGKSTNEFLNGIIDEWCEKNGVDLS